MPDADITVVNPPVIVPASVVLADLAALAVAGVRTYSLTGERVKTDWIKVAGVYAWDAAAPASDYTPITISGADKARVIAAVNARGVAAPIIYGDEVPFLSTVVRTLDATPTEIYRMTLTLTTGYQTRSTVTGVDAGNGALKTMYVSVAVKRLLAGALLVGAPVVMASHNDAAAAAWTVSAAVAGNDLIVSVTGAAGRSIDWRVAGVVTSFAPAGLP
jgi:hypothetical protein